MATQSDLTPFEMIAGIFEHPEEYRHKTSLAWGIGVRLNQMNRLPGQDDRPDFLVRGEQGVPSFAIALDALARTPRNPLHVQMLAETLASGVVATQEFATGQIVDPQIEAALVDKLIHFGLAT